MVPRKRSSPRLNPDERTYLALGRSFPSPGPGRYVESPTAAKLDRFFVLDGVPGVFAEETTLVTVTADS